MSRETETGQGGVAMGGLSVTGCLADFSVNMFHPYGGKKSSLKEAQWSPLSDTERKDSLSINVEFVKFHLSRSRKLDFHADQDHSKATVRFSSESFRDFFLSTVRSARINEKTTTYLQFVDLR